MMKYLIGLGGLLVVVVGGYILLVPEVDPQETPQVPVVVDTTPEPAPDPDSAPDPSPAPDPDAETLLEDMAADAREDLPRTVTDTLTLTDTVFLPRMRIMEYTYVTTADDARATAREMRALIEARAETICREGEEMFGMDVTLRNSFKNRDGTLFQRVYLLPEDCQSFY